MVTISLSELYHLRSLVSKATEHVKDLSAFSDAEKARGHFNDLSSLGENFDYSREKKVRQIQYDVAGMINQTLDAMIDGASQKASGER
jgi:hypothetical protein